MRKIIERCPACSGELIITQLSCSQCSTVINGHFRATRFARLTAPELAFLEVFVKNRGNVKEMERELGDSYWSIRNRLNELIAALGYDDAPPDEPVPDQALGEARQSILARLEDGSLTVQEAAELLGRLGA